MSGFLNFFGQILSFGRGGVSFVALVLLSLWMLKQPLERKQFIGESVVSYIFFPVQITIHWLTTYRDLVNENDILKTQVAQLSIQNQFYKQQILQQMRLDAMVDYQADTLKNTTIAKVVARDPALLDLSLVINKGLQDSININMPVFTPKGLIGRISKIFQNHAIVQLLHDPTSRVALMQTRTRLLGILQSNDSRRLFFTFPRQSDVKSGDTLMTSGFGGIFPQGIPVGIVSKFYQADLQVMRLAEVQLFQNPAYLEEVFVLKSQSSWIIQKTLDPLISDTLQDSLSQKPTL
jgi:rod shape-determining protein MreC